MAIDAQEPLAKTAARVGAIKDRQMLIFEMRRAFQRHRPTDMGIGVFNLFFCEAKGGEHIEIEIIQLRIAEAQNVTAEIITKAEAVKRELNVEG